MALFALSGFSALIYQSIWTQYLGLVLGHAAHAQTLVLALFMGGMALGAWGASRFALRWRRLVLVYAVAEALIGLAGLGFHAAFQAYSAFSEHTMLPLLGAHAASWAWLSAGALIAPQTVLLGATFPLLAAGLLRGSQRDASEQLGGLYFANSLGAAAGALASTFLLLPWGGLPGALAVAGALNLLVAAGAALAAGPACAARPAESDATGPAGGGALRRLGLIVMAGTLLSSAASFGYEIGWVRMLNQALGTTLHGFELMLAAFIGGLALGGAWVRHKGASIADPIRYAGMAQLAMGVAALLSIPLLAQSFDAVAWIMSALGRTDPGYVLYRWATALLALAVMLPAAFLAGMTLPLFTAGLLRAGAGERAIGRVYAANTLGAILGVLLTVHALIPTLGVSLTLVACAVLDVLVGVALLRGVSPRRWSATVLLASLAALLVALAVVRVGLPDRAKQATGVFRHGNAVARPDELVFFKDGATATVSVRSDGNTSIISTNGKPDAALRGFEQLPTADEPTMLMLGALPLALHPNPRRVAMVGWGSGLSTHVALASDRIERIDTLEIEPTMHEAARWFMARTARAYQDPRSRVHFDDARRFLASQTEPYDLIISEPSNPWVSGVASLFTQEFYGQARRRLAADGLFVQWIHLYEMSDALLAQMLRALQQEFPHAELYLTNTADLVIAAGTRPLPEPSTTPWALSKLHPELSRVGLATPLDLQLRRLGGSAMLRTFLRMHPGQPHSDFHPTVALQAPSHRFAGRNAAQLKQLVTLGLPLLPTLECRPTLGAGLPTEAALGSELARLHRDAHEAALALTEGQAQPALYVRNTPLAETVAMLAALRRRAIAHDDSALAMQLSYLAGYTLGFLEPPLARRLWDAAAWRAELPDLPPDVQSLLALYEAVARADWAQTQTRAAEVLAAQRYAQAQALREQVMVLGQLAGLAAGDGSAPARWEQQWGKSVQRGSRAVQRDFLRAWADGKEPRCPAP
jgi:spermidine synthase